MARKKSIHYVNNSDFSTAVVEYVERVQKARKEDKKIPTVPDYIAQCFLKIAEGLSHKGNFIKSYRSIISEKKQYDKLPSSAKKIIRGAEL